jgi:hypothetical protein
MSTRFTVDITVTREDAEDCFDSAVMVELEAPISDPRRSTPGSDIDDASLEVLAKRCATQIAAFLRSQFPDAEITPMTSSYGAGIQPLPRHPI